VDNDRCPAATQEMTKKGRTVQKWVRFRVRTAW